MVSVHRQGFVIPADDNIQSPCVDDIKHDIMYRQSNDPFFDAFEHCVFSFEDALSKAKPIKWKGYESYISNNKNVCGAQTHIQTKAPISYNNCNVKNSQNEKKPRIICKYFRIGRCMKGNDCEWSHIMGSDYATMDWCQFGTKCERRPDCPFMHVDQVDNPKECERYAAGFCHNGPACKYIHKKLPPTDLPFIADITIKMYEESRIYREGDERRAEMYKTSICFAFQKGCCKKSKNKCPFAHGYMDMSQAGVAKLKRNEWYKEYEEITYKNDDYGSDDSDSDNDDNNSILSDFSTENSIRGMLYDDGKGGLMISDTRRVVSLFLNKEGRWMRYDADNNLIVA